MRALGLSMCTARRDLLEQSIRREQKRRVKSAKSPGEPGKMTRVSCPAPDTLQAFLDGALPSDELVDLDARLDDCPECRTVLLAAGDTQPLPDAQVKPGAPPRFSPGSVVAERYRVIE